MPTRILSDLRDTKLAVPRAKLKVVRGPDKGLVFEFGDRGAALIGTGAEADVLLRDDSVSARHAELRATADGFVLRDLGSTNGTRVGELMIREVVLLARSPCFCVGTTELRLLVDKEAVTHDLSAQDRFGQVVGRSPGMRRVYSILEQVATRDTTLLMEGESGVGKEALAEGVHRASTRSAGPFVVVDCGAIPAGLLESELFGHERGAFTSADRARVGLFDEARGGTLFLDEIGELPLDLQPKLLRVLDAKEFRRVGASTPSTADVRIIAATHQNLEQQVESGRFRRDLFFRLAVIRVRVPPLRHRREDLPAIAQALCARLRPDVDSERLLAPVLGALAAHSWPGNVRELRNVIERLLVVGDLPTQVRERPARGAYTDARREAIDQFERAYARDLLAAAGGVVSRAAEAAGISRQMFYHLLRHDRPSDDVGEG